jgi:hypothetical protein
MLILKAGKGISVHEQEVIKLQNACRRSFERFRTESKKTLNLLAEARQFPNCVETRTALITQLDQEDRAQGRYERLRRRLYTLLISPDEAERVKL